METLHDKLVAMFGADFPKVYRVTARKDAVGVDLDLTKITVDIAVKAMLHGFKQKIADSAANAKMNACVAIAGNKKEGESEAAYTARLTKAASDVTFAEIDAEALRLMEKTRDTLEAGSWGVERAEAGEAVDMRPIAYAMAVYVKKLATDITGWADMKVPARRVAVNAWLDAKDGRRAAVMAKVAEEAALDI